MATTHAQLTDRASLRHAIAATVTAAATLVCITFVAPGQAAASATAKPAYGWPIKPFHRQHPVRAFFGDPRIGGRSHSFHFGVDISCPDGTPVYATITGRAYISPRHTETVSVIADHGNVEFAYWHIEPTIHSGQRVTAYRTVIGKVVASWEHVHFAEHRNGVYVNPLRPGAMGPYTDTTVPTVRAVTVHAVNARSVATASRGAAAHGRVDLVAEAYDATSIPISGPWHDKPLTPALLRWRLLDGKRVVTGWRTAVDFRLTYPSNESVEPDVHELDAAEQEDLGRALRVLSGARARHPQAPRRDVPRAGQGDRHPRQQRDRVTFPSRLPTTHESRVADNGAILRGIADRAAYDVRCRRGPRTPVEGDRVSGIGARPGRRGVACGPQERRWCSRSPSQGRRSGCPRDRRTRSGRTRPAQRF